KQATQVVRTRGDYRTVRNSQRRAALGRNTRAFDIVDVLDEADFTDVDLLQSRFDEAAARVDVVIGELLLDLSDAQPVGNQLVGIEANLVFTCGTAESGDLDDIRNGFQVFLDDPIFNRLQ